MPDIAPLNLDHLFIVRVWREAAEPAAWPWRGSVEHVPSGQRLHFSTLADLIDFMTWRLDSPAAPPPGDGAEGTQGPRR